MTEIDTAFDPLLIVFIVIAITIGFALIWFFVLFLIARLSGWATLARHFADPDWQASRARLSSRKGKNFNFVSMKLGPLGQYGSSLGVAIAANGLYIWPIFPFRPGHPPLYIPWRAISDVQAGSMLFRTTTRLAISLPGRKQKHLTFFGKALGKAITEQWLQTNK